jgi:hypothetical protein
MQRLTPAATALICVALAACGTALPVVNRSSFNPQLPDMQLPGGRVCTVSGQGSCLAMSSSPAMACLTARGRCAVTGRVQSLELLEADAR